VYALPVVETTGYITLSLRDREKVNVRITEITELNIMKNPVILSKYLKFRRSRLSPGIGISKFEHPTSNIEHRTLN
jgi:hypothetical protein